MISRSRSGPTVAAISMECTTSANNTVTCLYSADWVAGVSGEPHSLQNLAVDAAKAPHDLHERSAAVSAAGPSPLPSTSVSCHRWSDMSAISHPGTLPDSPFPRRRTAVGCIQICTPIDCWMKRATRYSCRRSELRTRGRGSRVSVGRLDESSNVLTVEPAHRSTHHGRAAFPNERRTRSRVPTWRRDTLRELASLTMVLPAVNR
jgi:hypothetical protein